MEKPQEVRMDTVELLVEVSVAMGSREIARLDTQAEDLSQVSLHDPESVLEAESGAVIPFKFSLDLVEIF